MFGIYTKITAVSGKHQELLDMLLRAAKGMETVESCKAYIVNKSTTEPDVVWVTEIWDTKQSHDASLMDENARALISQALPLIAKSPEQIVLSPVGGKGL